MSFAFRIRGIYATALTRFFLDGGANIVSPSQIIEERFDPSRNFLHDQLPDACFEDTENGQGVVLRGSRDAVCWASEKIRPAFLDAVFRDAPVSGENGGALEIEFPAVSKAVLDGLRHSVIPTVPMHHRLRLIAPDFLDLVEQSALPDHPEARESFGQNLETRFIWDTYRTGTELGIDHVKLDGRVLHLSPGEIIACHRGESRLVIKRSRFSGRHRYDGLEVEKAEGDYALSEIVSGRWYYRHTYFRRGGERIGTYCNVNTPIELYPDRIRYVDLEVDVVERAGENPAIIDQQHLESHHAAGFISAELKKKAMETARSLIELNAASPNPA